jgi:choline/glycine/proline betaine transport protein
MLIICYGLLKGLRMEGLKRQLLGVPQTPVSSGRRVNWKQRLRNLSSHPSKQEMLTFMQKVVTPSMQQVAEEIRHTGLDVTIEEKPDYIELKVFYGDEDDFVYGIHAVGHLIPNFAFPQYERGSSDSGKRYYRAEVYLAEGSQHYDLFGYNQEQIIDDVLIQYEKHMHFLHVAG